MSNSFLEINREKNLPEERYDEKLFKQAYKAAIEARELEEKKRRRRSLGKFTLLTFIPVLVLSLVLSFFIFRKDIPEYIEPSSVNQHSVLDKWDEGYDINPPYLGISTENISAQSALVFNTNSGSILYEKDIDERSSIASITKLLTAIIIIENYKLEDSIEVSLDNIPENLSWTLELQQGDTIKVDTLLRVLLISSYNDAAYVIANAYPNGGYNGFINEMNRKAKSLRMSNSKFSNPAGLDDENNYSTARDVARLVSASINYSYITDLVKRSSSVISWTSNDELINKTIYSTNQLYGEKSKCKGYENR
jgi:D-alanyl-D-alanine carboxypeptidase